MTRGAIARRHFNPCGACQGPDSNDTVRPTVVTMQICGHVFRAESFNPGQAMLAVLDQADEHCKQGKICVPRMAMRDKA